MKARLFIFQFCATVVVLMTSSQCPGFHCIFIYLLVNFFFFFNDEKVRSCQVESLAWSGVTDGCCGNLKAVLLLILRICDSLVTVN